MRTRFAPSPTGPLHLGHAFAAIFAHDLALRHGGTFLLRIEDIDRTRARPEWEQGIYDDLRWLGTRLGNARPASIGPHASLCGGARRPLGERGALSMRLLPPRRC